MNRDYQIIYIGGPSSSGKTSLARALQEKLPIPYLHIGIDALISMMPDRLNDWTGGVASEGFSWLADTDSEGHPIQTLRVGPYAGMVCNSLHAIVLCLLQEGHHLILDDIPLSPADFLKWKETLKGWSSLYVGVTAPLDVLEHRESTRGDRMVGSARAQYHASRMDFGYDLVLDSSLLTLSDQLALIASIQPEGGQTN
ncbi:MAG: AAA family ATPase [Chlamydiia bacterium]|nr:AAA family ATPase [Chlamydiia bacterium]